MKSKLQIVPVLLAATVLAAGFGPMRSAQAGEIDCDRIELRVEIDGYITTYCYYETATRSEARAEWEIVVVEGAESYAIVVAAHAFASTYLTRQTMQSMIEDLQEDGLKVRWTDRIKHEEYAIQRFTTIESSGRETSCVGFNRNLPALNGRSKHRLYGFLCMAGRGQLENDSIIEFVNAVRD